MANSKYDLELLVTEHDGVHVIGTPERSHIDADNVGPLRERVLASLIDAACSGVIIDLTHVDHLDTTGLGALVETRAYAMDVAKGFSIYGAQEKIERLFAITALDQLFDFATDLPTETTD